MGQEHFAVEGSAWVEFVGQLSEWLAASGFPTGASKSNAFGNNGKITALVKAINEIIPEQVDSEGKRLPRQMRRVSISDDSLAGSIIDARKEYGRLHGEVGGG
jgi:hypothetical protein